MISMTVAEEKTWDDRAANAPVTLETSRQVGR